MKKCTASTREHEFEGLKGYKTKVKPIKNLIKSCEIDMRKVVRNATKWNAKGNQNDEKHGLKIDAKMRGPGRPWRGAVGGQKTPVPRGPMVPIYE